MGIINYIFQRGKQRVSYDFDGLFENIQQNAMKSIALETCANYIARTFSKSSFLFDGDAKSKAEHWAIGLITSPTQTRLLLSFGLALLRRLFKMVKL